MSFGNTREKTKYQRYDIMVKMTDVVEVHGFGSHFRGSRACGDTDVLLLHEDISLASCNFVLKCKRALLSGSPQLHVTMLSRSEEASLGFIATANAQHVGAICAESFDADIEYLATHLAA